MVAVVERTNTVLTKTSVYRGTDFPFFSDLFRKKFQCLSVESVPKSEKKSIPRVKFSDFGTDLFLEQIYFFRAPARGNRSTFSGPRRESASLFLTFFPTSFFYVRWYLKKVSLAQTSLSFVFDTDIPFKPLLIALGPSPFF